jgi:hypothetical protein
MKPFNNNRSISQSYEKVRRDKQITLPGELNSHPSNSHLLSTNQEFKILKSSKDISQMQDAPKYKQQYRESNHPSISEMNDRNLRHSPAPQRISYQYGNSGHDAFNKIEQIETENENLHLKNKELMHRLSYLEKNSEKISERAIELEMQNKKLKYLLSRQKESMAELQQVLMQKDHMIKSLVEFNSKIENLKLNTQSNQNCQKSLAVRQNSQHLNKNEKLMDDFSMPRTILEPMNPKPGEYSNLLSLKLDDVHLQNLSNGLSNIKPTKERFDHLSPSPDFNEFTDNSAYLNSFNNKDPTKDGLVLGSEKNFTFQAYSNFI